MSACYCDFDPPEFSRVSVVTARVSHKCESCGCNIPSGSRYERAVGKWPDGFDSFATCAECLALRQYVTAHVPCFCWTYQNLYEDATEILREYCHHVPGMAMEAGRMLVNMRRRLMAREEE